MEKKTHSKYGSASVIIIAIMAVTIIILGAKVFFFSGKEASQTPKPTAKGAVSTPQKSASTATPQSASTDTPQSASTDTNKKAVTKYLTNSEISAMLQKPADQIDFFILAESIAQSEDPDSFQTQFMNVFGQKMRTLTYNEKWMERYQLFQAVEALSWDLLNMEWKQFRHDLLTRYKDNLLQADDRVKREEYRNIIMKFQPDHPLVQQDLAQDQLQKLLVRRKYDEAEKFIANIKDERLRQKLQYRLEHTKRKIQQYDQERNRRNIEARRQHDDMNRNNRMRADGRPVRNQKFGTVDINGRKISPLGQVMMNFSNGNKDEIVKMYKSGFDFNRKIKINKVEYTLFRHMLERIKKSSLPMRQGQIECILALLDSGFKPTEEDRKIIQTIDGLAGNF